MTDTPNTEDSADYGMFSNEGNERVAQIVEDTVKALPDSDLRGVLDAVCLSLYKLADDESAFAEAGDTVVRDAVYEELRLRFPSSNPTGTPDAALAKIVAAVRQIEGALANLRDAETIIEEQTNGSIRSGLGDVRAALHNLVGDDPEAEAVLGHLRAILTMNRSASQVW